MTKFENIRFIKADCLEPDSDSFKDSVKDSDAVIHSVGALLDPAGKFNYKDLIKDIESGEILKKNPFDIAKNIFEDAVKDKTSIRTSVYEQSLEALNRDSCINTAKALAAGHSKDSQNKNFVFISASKSIAPTL